MTKLQTMLESMPPPALKDGRTFVTIAALAEQLREKRHTVTVMMTRLIDRGYVRRCSKGRYALTRQGQKIRASGWPKPVPSKVPRMHKDALAERLWSALRRLRKATLPELLELAARDERQADAYSRHILRGWVAAGLVVRLPGRRGKWILPTDIGAKAPRVIDLGRKVFEPNTGRTIELPADSRGAR